MALKKKKVALNVSSGLITYILIVRKYVISTPKLYLHENRNVLVSLLSDVVK